MSAELKFRGVSYHEDIVTEYVDEVEKYLFNRTPIPVDEREHVYLLVRIIDKFVDHENEKVLDRIDYYRKTHYPGYEGSYITTTGLYVVEHEKGDFPIPGEYDPVCSLDPKDTIVVSHMISISDNIDSNDFIITNIQDCPIKRMVDQHNDKIRFNQSIAVRLNEKIAQGGRSSHVEISANETKMIDEDIIDHFMTEGWEVFVEESNGKTRVRAKRV